MKIILLSVGISCLLLVNISAQKTITCKVDDPACLFNGVTLGPSEAVSIKTDPANFNANKIEWVVFSSSSVYSVPSEVFTKFPNLKLFWASGQKIQEVKMDSFWNARNLEQIWMSNNALTFLHRDTFKGLEGLRKIWLEHNKLSAMHPRMFAHLTFLFDLDLRGNTCINKKFNPVTSLATVEKELASCAANHPASLGDLLDLEKRHERKLELLTKLFYNVDERNEENAKDIKEMKKMIEKIFDMLTSK